MASMEKSEPLKKENKRKRESKKVGVRADIFAWVWMDGFDRRRSWNRLIVNNKKGRSCLLVGDEPRNPD